MLMHLLTHLGTLQQHSGKRYTMFYGPWQGRLQAPKAVK